MLLGAPIKVGFTALVACDNGVILDLADIFTEINILWPKPEIDFFIDLPTRYFECFVIHYIGKQI